MRKAFTLLEMLVVITIVVVLIAIILPVFMNAKYQVLVDVCKSNLHQVGVGVLAYTIDNDGYYPNGYISNGNPNADGEYGRDTNYSWAVYQKRKDPPTSSGHVVGNQDLVAILADYYGGVDGMRDTYMCSFVEDGYRQNMKQTDKLWYGTNSGQQPFSLMWNLQGRDVWGIKKGMYKVGDRWQQGKRYPKYENMWFNVLAGDMIRPSGYGGARASHWNLGNPKPFRETTLVGGFDLDPGEATNGNFLIDDGSVSNHNDMQKDRDHVGGPSSFMVPGEYATQGPQG